MASRQSARLLCNLHSCGLLRQPWGSALSVASCSGSGVLSGTTASSSEAQHSLFRLAASLSQLRGFAVPAHTLLTMPSLSPTMTQGNIASWKKKEGDLIAPGQILAEVETDKATIEWESQEDGYIARILQPDGAKDVPVGAPVLVLVEDAESIPAFRDYKPGAAGGKPAAAAAPPPPTSAAPTPAKPAAAASSWPAHQTLAFPALSPTMSAGNILDWKKQVGDPVAPGDVYCEVETDKATISWEAQEDGFIAQILLPAGSKDIPVGSPAVILVEDKGTVASFAGFTASDAASGGAAPSTSAPPAAAAAPASAPTPSAPPSPATPVVASGGAGGRVKASPYARKLAAASGVVLDGVAGSGPGGRVVAADVQAAASAPKTAPTAAVGGAGPAIVDSSAGYIDIPHTQIRRVTAQRLLESKQTIPHYYLTVEVQVDAMMKLRESINASFGKDAGTKISVNDFVIKAAALALKKVPGVNSSWQKDFIRQYNGVDISVAVQTPVGLLTPIVRDAHTKGLAAISGDVKSLARKAKDGKLAPAEFMGGTFTISNLGMYGVKSFAAIVNPPQAAILAVGGTQKKVVSSKEGGFSEVSVMNVTLSCDHRVIDGAMGAEWLAAFKGFVEAPYTMLL